MATLRLDDGQRNTIIGGFHSVIERATNNKAFPMAKEEVWEFGLSLLPEKTVEYYLYLREQALGLTSSQSWRPTFQLTTDHHQYEFTFNEGELPKSKMVVGHKHPKYAEILDWAEHNCVLAEQVILAQRVVTRIINVCSSAGQIKRVMQPEILRFLPDHIMQSFSDAERQSRIPKNLELHEGDLELVANTLAIGALSLENQPGLSVDVTRKKID